MATAISERARWLFLSHLAEQILATETPSELIRSLSHQILSHTEADTLLHYLLDKSGNSLKLNAWAGVSEEMVHRFGQIPCPTGICQTLSLCGQEFPLREKCPCGSVLSELMKTHGIKCFACHPLVAHGRNVGTLAFGSHTLTSFTPDDLELMRTVATQVLTAIYRVQNEQRLRETEERLRVLSEATFEGILLNENEIIVDLNQQLADLVGWPIEELKGQEILKFIAPEDWVKVQESISSDQEILSEYRVIHKDGSLRIFEARSRPSMVHESSRGVTVVRDITERKQLESDLLQRGKELQDLNAQLEQRVRERTGEIERLVAQLQALSVKLIQVEQHERQHLATILHDDIQQLLVASKMRVEQCMHAPHHRRNAALCQEASQILQEALEHCRSLVVELYPPVLQQSGLVAALLWLAQQFQQKHRFRVTVVVNPQAEPPTLELRSLLFESTRELLLNAVKHAQSPHAQVTLARTPDQEISLCVQDQGSGFDPGVQRHQTSSGFGLFSLQQRLTHIGGRMEIDSAPGQGTRITLLVPLEATSRSDRPEAI